MWLFFGGGGGWLPPVNEPLCSSTLSGSFAELGQNLSKEDDFVCILKIVKFCRIKLAFQVLQILI